MTRTRVDHGGAFTYFVDSHFSRWEGAMGALAVLFVALALRNESVPGTVPAPVFWVLIALFAAEFVARCYDQGRGYRWTYARGHWLDILACVPLLGVLRAVRILRLLRLIPVVRRGLKSVNGEGLSTRDTVWFIGLSMLLLWLGLAYALYALEHGVNSHMQSYFDAMYWSLLTVLTVGNASPGGHVTPDARIITGLLTFAGIGLVGVASSRMTAWWLHEEDNESVLLQELHDLKDEVTLLRASLADVVLVPGTYRGALPPTTDRDESVVDEVRS